jgi:hypothetical protein
MKENYKIDAFLDFNKKILFILDENKNVIPANVFEFGSFFEDGKNRIIKQETINNKLVSTVFMGINHNFTPGGKLKVFETMVFENDDFKDLYQDRYSTYEEALSGHENAVQWVLNGCKEYD